VIAGGEAFSWNNKNWVKPVFLLGCYGCIFHGTGNSAQLFQNFGISGGGCLSPPNPPGYATGPPLMALNDFTSGGRVLNSAPLTQLHRRWSSSLEPWHLPTVLCVKGEIKSRKKLFHSHSTVPVVASTSRRSSCTELDTRKLRGTGKWNLPVVIPFPLCYRFCY
jgi:hypothetical protein